MADFLERILDARKKTVEEAKGIRSLSELEKMCNNIPLIPFLEAINKSDRISLICEMKKRSPSAGMIRPDYDVVRIAESYKRGGASALSVLTENEFFGGDITDIEKAKSQVTLPVLRKDFIFDPYQIVEARAFGADAVLLIADMLPGSLLADLVDVARQFTVEPLVEVFSTENLPAALNTGAKLMGINTRNLRTLQMNPGNILNISRLIPHDRVLVAESGIKTADDIQNLKALRISAALIGESFLKQDNIEAGVQKLAVAAQGVLQ